MQLVASWASIDQRVLLSFSKAALDVFKTHIQPPYSDKESGGLLLGTVHGDNLLITEATVPTPWDKRLSNLFERFPFVHSEIAVTRWRASQGTIRYLGEWHTHGEDIPRPSQLDLKEWKSLSIKRQDGRPVLAVIVGRKGMHVELVPKSGTGLVMHATSDMHQE